MLNFEPEFSNYLIENRILSVREDFGISGSDYRINSQIRAKEVRVIVDETNENLGVIPLREAIQIAEDRELDLVEVAPDAKPPVCRIMDFGKFQYNKQKRERKARKQQKVVEVKKVRLSPSIDDFHQDIKVKKAREWIEDGMKVQFSIRFRGRQNLHTDIGRKLLEGIAEDMSDIAVVEQRAIQEGSNMYMTLAPQPDKK
jgi:translation initiation factor IF-3